MSNKKQNSFDRRATRRRRHLRKTATKGRFRLSVFRSHRQIYVQILDDANHKTLVSAASLEKSLTPEGGADQKAAIKIGEAIAKRALQKNIRKVYFDCGGYRYHGRIKALAQAARENGLEF